MNKLLRSSLLTPFVLGALLTLLATDVLAGARADVWPIGTARVERAAARIVTRTADGGPGTLRQALLDAARGDTLTFDPVVFPPASPATITLTSGPLPNLDAGNVTVDATSAGVILNGSRLTGWENGLSITSSGNTVKGLRIVGFSGAGVNIIGAAAMSNTVRDNHIGIGATFVRQAFPTDLAISPAYATDCTLYAATATTGIHKSTDCGATWLEANTGLTELRLTQVELPPDAADSLTAYALAENGYLFGTSDGSATWRLTSTALKEIDRRNLILSAGFTADRTMYVAAQGWSWDTFGGQPGVFKSTDGGVTWARTAGALSDLHVRRVIGTTDAAAAGVVFALTDSGIERTTDGGATWTTVAKPGGTLLDLALSPTYAADHTVYLAAEGGLIYSSTTGGGSWAAAPTPRSDPGHLALSPHFAADRTLCHGGSGSNDTAYCSTDGGATWAQAPTGLRSNYNDRGGSGLVFSPNFATDGTIYAAATIGLARSTNRGGAWTWLAGFRPQGNGCGVQIWGGAQFNTIGPANVIGNNGNGVNIWDDSAYNRIGGNFIGTDAAGLHAQANVSDGINVDAPHNTIGGALGRNIVSGNLGAGLSIGRGGWANVVVGNYIGVASTGRGALGNGGPGAALHGGASANVIGGATVANRNVISGNGAGVSLGGSGTMSNTISGNYIGLDATGSVALGNRSVGVGLGDAAQANSVIGNLISGNHDWGIYVYGANTSANIVSGNLVGTNAGGDGAIPNENGGISIGGAASGNRVGGTTAAERNVISGNANDGVRIAGSGTLSNAIQGNYIGTDATGTESLGNVTGVRLESGATQNVIGGAMAGERNVISGNRNDGVWIAGSGTQSNTIEGNYIGTDATGTAGLGNGTGVRLESGALQNVIGPANVIAFNHAGGVRVRDAATRYNTITVNTVYSNTGRGIELSDSANDAIQPPVIAYHDLATGTASGVACPHCAVELFSDAADEGRWYEGATTADAAGIFTFTKETAFTGHYVTATATDARGNTSAFAAVAGSEPMPVLVTNASDTVNGEVTSIPALLADPGPDGVSFREAIYASNHTLGPKILLFAPSLKGSTILYGSGGITDEMIELASGHLTIDGDVDGDSQPDITLDGSLDTSYGPLNSGIFIWSSENEIRHLSFVQFSATAIQTSCPSPDCTPRQIHGNRILENVISSTRPGANAVHIGVFGRLSGSDGPVLSDLSIQDTVIAGNRVSVGANGVGIRPGGGGASRNRIVDITVRDNVFVGGTALDIGAADMASDYWGSSGQVFYSDNNLIEHLTITGNLIEDALIGIDVYAANQGNRYNQVRDVHIIGNTLRRTNLGMYLFPSGNGGRERSTSYNVMGEIEISHNMLSDVDYGIWVSAGDLPSSPSYPFAVGISDNRITDVSITDNMIEDYEVVGISVWGGCVGNHGLYSSRNILEQMTLSGNQILAPKLYADTTGLTLIGGEGFEGLAEGNAIRGVTLSGNTVQSNHVGISLVGGQGAGAQGNSVVVVALAGNDLHGSPEPLRVISNSEGAMDNRVTILGGSRVYYLPIILRHLRSRDSRSP